MRFFTRPSSSRRFPSLLALAVLGLGLGLGAEARAGYIASNLTASQGYNTGSAYNLTGPAAVQGGQGFVLGVSFTSASTVTFDSAQLALSFMSGTNALNVSLMTDAGGTPSGTTLETIRITGIGASPGLVTATSTTHSVLTAGVSYWLVATYGASDTYMKWYLNSTGATGQTAYRSDSSTAQGSWNAYPGGTNPAFAISGSPAATAAAVDSPSSAFLVGIGGLGLLTRGWVRRRPEGSVVAA